MENIQKRLKMKRKELFGKTLFVNVKHEDDDQEYGEYYEEKDFHPKLWTFIQKAPKEFSFIWKEEVLLNNKAISAKEYIESKALNNIIDNYHEEDFERGITLYKFEMKNRDYNKMILEDEEGSFIDEDCSSCGHLMEIYNKPSNWHSKLKGNIYRCSNEECRKEDFSRVKFILKPKEYYIKRALKDMSGYTILEYSSELLEKFSKKFETNFEECLTKPDMDWKDEKDIICMCCKSKKSKEPLYIAVKNNPKYEDSKIYFIYRCPDCGNKQSTSIASDRFKDILGEGL
jgi:hypothetical protein